MVLIKQPAVPPVFIIFYRLLRQFKSSETLAFHYGLLVCPPLWSRLEYQLLDELPLNLCTDIHDPQRINPNHFGEPLTIPLGETPGHLHMNKQ